MPELYVANQKGTGKVNGANSTSIAKNEITSVNTTLRAARLEQENISC